MAWIPNIANRMSDAFSEFLEDVGRCIQANQISFLGYGSDVVARRCKQAIYASEWKAFNRNFNVRTEKSQIAITINTEHIGVSVSLICLGIVRFLHQWCRIGYSIMRTVGGRPNIEWQNRPFTVLQCFGSERLINREDLFWEFCRSKRINALDFSGGALLACGYFTEGPSQNMKWFRSKFALEAILRINPPSSIREVLLLLYSHVRCFLSFFTTLRRFPLVCLLHEDFAVHGLMTHLNSRGLILFWIIDNSSVIQQPLPITCLPRRRFQTGVVFYSINNKSIMLGDDCIEWVYLAWNFLALDIGWAWNLDQAAWLSKNTLLESIIISGPILYREAPVSRVFMPHTKPCFEILLFDTRIVSADDCASYFGKYYENYHCEDMAIRFLNDIVEVVAAARCISVDYTIRIRLKQKSRLVAKATLGSINGVKRLRHSRGHGLSWKYQSLIDKLLLSHTIGAFAPDADLYAVLSDCNLVIAMPFTSVNYFADVIGLPSIYYDPTGRLKHNYVLGDNMAYIQMLPALELYVQKMLLEWSVIQS